MSRLLSAKFSRRDFLKFAAAAASALAAGPLPKAASQGFPLQGRVLSNSVPLHKQPNLDSEVVRVYWKDDPIAITGSTVGGELPAHNRLWYRVEDLGYIHSGSVQPVEVRTHAAVADLPEGGALAEVTVPFTDAYWKPGFENRFAYRYYYETTYWVTGLVPDSLGAPWYRIAGDKWDQTYFVPAQHLRIIPPVELEPISPDVPAEAKRLVVRTDLQMLIAYEYDRPVFAARASTGTSFRNGNFFTPAGRHKTFHKRPSRHMAAGNLAVGGYDLPGVPWVTYFTESGVAIHGTYWHNDFGIPRSHGCVNVTSRAARWIYLWTQPYVPPNEQVVYADYGTILDVI